MKSSEPTIFDVAQAAGVTVKAALRVVHGETGVQPQLKAQVERAIAKLGYRPYGTGTISARSQSTNSLEKF